MTPHSWRTIIGTAFALFEDAGRRGFGTSPFWLGGGTVLMLRFRHRLSKDIDLFGYRAQRLSVLSPRLNAAAAALVDDFIEQANTLKLVTPAGDLDVIISGDVTAPVVRTTMTVNGRRIEVEPTEEILAKKLFYRAASFKPRDVYDLATALRLAPAEAVTAIDASSSKTGLLLRRLDELEALPARDLLDGILPYDASLAFADGMIDAVRRAVASRMPTDKDAGEDS